MSVCDVVNTSAEKVAEIEVNDNLFGVKVDTGILHEVVCMQRANRRRGTASTKTRGEVRGGGAKPWRQKGTGRARAGSRTSPVWRGGGTTFGPKPRDYSYSMPKKVRRLALRMALSARMNEGNLVFLDQFSMDAPKTKEFVNRSVEFKPPAHTAVVRLRLIAVKLRRGRFIGCYFDALSLLAKKAQDWQ